MILVVWTKIGVLQLVKQKCGLHCQKDRVLVFTNYNPVYYSIKYLVLDGEVFVYFVELWWCFQVKHIVAEDGEIDLSIHKRRPPLKLE
jgi:hypothetical protein